MAETDAAGKAAARDQGFWRDRATVANYLDTSRQAIPLGAEQMDAAFRVIAAYNTPVRSVLDLGAGDGAMAREVAKHYPLERITLVDFSEPMLERARERFADADGAVGIVQADLSEPGWVSRITVDAAAYDLVVSRYAIHHLTDDRKRELFGEILDLLTPGGMFVNVEHVASVSPVHAGAFDDLLIEGMVATSEMSRKQAHDAYHARWDQEENILAPTDAQCAWLRDTGFVDVDVIMKIFELAVIVARRPGSVATH